MVLFVLTDTFKYWELLAFLIPVHQAIIEAFKLTGPRMRRYWEALAYVVYGPRTRPEGWQRAKVLLVHPVLNAISDVPVSVKVDERKLYDPSKPGPQERLIQSFLLRGVGESPVTEISDADIKNVIGIARLVASQGIRRISELLDDLIRSGPIIGSEVARRLRDALAEIEDADLRVMVNLWISELDGDQAKNAVVNPVGLMFWRSRFNERFFPSAIRTERELANAMKAAEFQYVQHLLKFSAFVAVLEAGAIGWWVMSQVAPPDLHRALNFIIAFLIAFGVMVLGPQGSKGLLDALKGLGARLKG